MVSYQLPYLLDWIDGVDDPGIAGQCGEAPGVVQILPFLGYIRRAETAGL